MKRFTLLGMFLVAALGLAAQSALRPVAQMVHDYHNSGTVFQKVNLFAGKETFQPTSAQNDVLGKGTVLTLNPAVRQAILENAPQAMEFTVPTTEWGAITLDLVRVNIFSPDFKAVSEQSNDQPIELAPMAFYRGTIKGLDNSLAAISVSGDEIMGFISDNSFGNLVIGKLEGSFTDEHLIYATRDLKLSAEAFCEMPDDTGDEANPNETTASERTTGDCVRLWVEVDRDLTTNKGGVNGVTTWITGVFNQVITLYANESIEVGIHYIYVWSGTGGNKYTGNTSSAVLGKFQNFRYNSFTGDLAILCNLKSNLGGVAAGFAGLCNTNRKQSMCFAGLQSTYQNVPTYSWTIMVCTHELGHLMSSRHTHACVWNGNNTAIDNCYTTEGGCPPGPPPTNGGTIMSYCHLTNYGINFNNGFGPQPGDKIRSGVAGATCLPANCTNYAPPGDDRTLGNASLSGKVQLTPNPATDRVQVDLNVRLNDGETGYVRVFDAQGRLVNVVNFTNANTTLTLQTGNLAPGLYFVDVTTASEQLTARLILN
ncbi:MAG TPA: M12 family metallo-peptidase [Saprospiraceae bacterium]|nr:M12 family metallo-peptidase [Saprospiraceae bacterium]